MIEALLHLTKPWDYLLLMDAGSSFDATNPKANQKLVSWLQELKTKSAFTYLSKHNGTRQRQEIVKYQLDADKPEYQWTTTKLMQAFHITHPSNWSGAKSPQYEGGFTLARNGPQLRELLALIYEALDQDIEIIADKYSGKKKIFPRLFPKHQPDNITRNHPQFIENRHDQSLQSVACKLLHVCIGKRTGRNNNPIVNSRIRHPKRAAVDKWEAQEYKDGQAAAQQGLHPLFGIYGAMAANTSAMTTSTGRSK